MFFATLLMPDHNPDIDRLINEYSKCLTRLCYMILKDFHLGEDAAWDALYKAYRGYNKLKKESSEKTWIMQIAVNVCKSYMRKSSYKEVTSKQYICLDYASEDPLIAEFQSDDSLALLNCVYNLSFKYRQVIVLRYYEDLSVSEISKLLKEKENTISVRIKRAREMLKALLKEDYDNE